MLYRTALFALVLTGCSEYDFNPHVQETPPADDEEEVPEVAQEPTGGITGRICAPNGNTYIPGAHVWVETDGSPVTTETDADGWFTLDGLYPGEYTVFVEKGSFSLEIDTEVFEDQVTELAEDECFSADDIEIAVVTGSYDEIEEIVDRLGFEYTLYNGTFSNEHVDLLRNPAALEDYNIIFFNCGMSSSWQTYDAEIAQNLRDYIYAGGSVYTSDWAYYLTEVTYPDMINFQGNDEVPGAAQMGSSGTVDAQVLDSGLVTALGSNQATIQFNLGGWAAMLEVGTGQSLLRGTYTYSSFSTHEGPLAARYYDGQGQMLYTSFHNSAQTTLDMDLLLEEIILSL